MKSQEFNKLYEKWQGKLERDFDCVVFNKSPEQMERLYNRLSRMNDKNTTFHLWKSEEYTHTIESSFGFDTEEWTSLDMEHIIETVIQHDRGFVPVYEDAKSTLKIIIDNLEDVKSGDEFYLCRYFNGEYDQTIFYITVENDDISLDWILCRDELCKTWHEENYGTYTGITMKK